MPPINFGAVEVQKGYFHHSTELIIELHVPVPSMKLPGQAVSSLGETGCRDFRAPRSSRGGRRGGELSHSIALLNVVCTRFTNLKNAQTDSALTIIVIIIIMQSDRHLQSNS